MGGSAGAMAGASGAAMGGSAGAASGGAAGSATGGSAGASAGGSGAAGAAGSAGAAMGGAGAGGTAGAAGSAGMAGADGGMAGAAGAAGSAGAAGTGGAAGGGAFTLTSPALDNMPGCSEDMADACDVFPNESISYMQNANESPELAWTGAPAGAMSFAMVLQDLSNGLAHWVLWNIPASTTMLPANVDKSDATPPVPAGSQQCNLGSGDGYFGPGSACNVYEFVVYALAVATFSPTQNTDAGQVRTQLQALDDDILGTASLRGRSNYMMMCTSTQLGPGQAKR